MLHRPGVHHGRRIGVPEQLAARRSAALSRDEIVRTAIGVADAEGADAISMRRIARELGSGTMSLYWHVTSKDELLDLMIDAITGEAEAPAPPGTGAPTCARRPLPPGTRCTGTGGR
jgi:hypothetical protein